MSVYLKLVEPWHRVPLLSDESIANYERLNVTPHKGTSYGEVERTHLAELKLARKLGFELIKIEKIDTVTADL